MQNNLIKENIKQALQIPRPSHVFWMKLRTKIKEFDSKAILGD